MSFFDNLCCTWFTEIKAFSKAVYLPRPKIEIPKTALAIGLVETKTQNSVSITANPQIFCHILVFSYVLTLKRVSEIKFAKQ